MNRSRPFGTLHPVVPNPMVMVLDLNDPKTLVELQDQIEGQINKLTLTDWIIDGFDPGPFFQLRFSQGIEIRTLTFGQNILQNAIQVPLRGRRKEIPLIRELMIPRLFMVELFDSLGQPFQGARTVLWFSFELG